MNLLYKCCSAVLLAITASSVLAKAEDLPANLNSNNQYAVDTAFVGVNILSPTADMPVADSTILVSQGKIVKIQPQSRPIPEHYKIVKLEDKWVIPGLIDGHIHLAQSGSAFTRPDTVDATKIMAYEKDQQWLLDNSTDILGDYIQQGITTVYDMGGPSEYLQHYRQVTQNGIYPDIYAAGTLLAPMDVPQLNINGNTFTQVTTAKAAVELVRQQLELGTNIIKMVWSQETGLSSQQLFDLYQPAIALAHQHNRLVAMHVEDLANAKVSIKAGADILVHGVMTDNIDEEFIQLMHKHKVTYMPTLTAYSHYFEWFKDQVQFSDLELKHGDPEIINSFKTLMDNLADTDQMFKIMLKYVPMVDKPEAQLAKLSEREQSIVSQLQTMFSQQTEQVQQQNLKLMQEAGVNIALGTDAGNPGTLHASSLLGEMLAWKSAGISNKNILKASTYGNAVALELDDSIGRLETGKQADFVVLEQNPYQQLSALESPFMTVKRGFTIELNQGEKQ